MKGKTLFVFISCLILGVSITYPIFTKNEDTPDLVSEEFDVIETSATPWWDSNWDYYKVITIDSIDQVGATLTNFPILINFTDADLANHALSDGSDIAFILIDNTTQLNHEIEYFNGATGALTAWVNVTSLPHDSDLKILMYYGNAGASSQEHITDTWNSDYAGVWHMNGIYDSTSNDNDGTLVSWESTNWKVGIIGEYAYFDGTNYFRINDAPEISGARDLAIMTFFQAEDYTVDREAIVNKWYGGSNKDYSLSVEPNRLQLATEDGTSHDNTWYVGHSEASYSWNHFCWNWHNGVPADGDLVLNGVWGHTSGEDYATCDDTTAYLVIGAGSGSYLGNYPLHGNITEIQIMNTFFSTPHWITTSFNTINNESVDCANPFISVGSEQSAPVPKSWKLEPHGYFTFTASGTFKNIQEGHFTFGNISSNNLIELGYFTFGNVSRQQLAEYGYFTFVGKGTDKLAESGYFTFGNSSSIKQIDIGYFTFGNTSSEKQVETGYFMFGNMSHIQQVEIGHFTFGNYSHWQNIDEGYFTFRNYSAWACFISEQEGVNIRLDASCSSDADEYRWSFEHEDGTTGTTGWISGDNADTYIATSLDEGTVIITVEVRNSYGGTDTVIDSFDIGDERDIIPYDECDGMDECEDNGHFWYDDECHLEDKPDWWEHDENTTDPTTYEEPSNLREGEWKIEPWIFIIPVGLLALLFFYKRRKFYKRKTHKVGNKYYDVYSNENNDTKYVKKRGKK